MNTKSIVSVLFTVLCVAAIGFAEQKRGASNIMIEAGGFRDVVFPHQAHQEVIEECNACHDLFPKSPRAIADLKSAGTLEKKQVMDQCRKCHREMKEAGAKTGPLQCGGCHVK